MPRIALVPCLLLLLCLSALCACSSGSDPGLDRTDGDTPDGDDSDGDAPDGDISDGDGEDGDQEEPEDGDTSGWGACPDIPEWDHSEDLQHMSPHWGLPDCRFRVHDVPTLFPRHPVSSWFECTTYNPPGSEPADSSEYGSYGVGNGTVFAQVGPWAPRNTLHGILGPDYQKNGQGFFSDFRTALHRDGTRLDWTSDQIWTLRDTQIVVTEQRVKGFPQVSLQTATFAPPPSSAAPLKRVIVQVIGVLLNDPENQDPVEDLRVRVQSYSQASLSDTDAPYLEQRRDDHRMRVRPLDGNAWDLLPSAFNNWPAFESHPFTLTWEEPRVFVMVYEFTRPDTEPGAGFDAVAEAGWESLMGLTRDWWQDWHGRGLRIRTRDFRVNDLLTAQKAIIRLQVADTGALVPMSHYTATWMRDGYAPARMLLKFGYPEEALRIMDYYFMAASARGSISNSMDASLNFDEPPPQPDWSAKIPFSGREKGEGPSHIPLMHTDYWRYFGQTENFAERWDYLVHTLKGQGITDEADATGLMYFSGDETFRPQLSANLGLPGGANYKFEDLAYSANTAFLFVSAAETLADMGEAMGKDASDIQWLRDHAALVREATERFYWLEEEDRYSPFIYMDTLKPETSPAEDVNTQALWTRYLDRDDPKARQNILSSFEAIGQESHLLQIVPREPVELLGYDIGGGLMTGMSPSYFLYNVAELGLPWADKTFDSAGTYVTKGGEAYEVGIFSQPGKPFCPIYFRGGGEGELYARIRPWEGSILAEALAHFLIGYDADVVAGRLTLAPRIPHDVPREDICGVAPRTTPYEDLDYPLEVSAENIPFGEHRVNLLYRHTYQHGYAFTLETATGETFAQLGITDLRVRLHAVASREMVIDADASEPAGLADSVTVVPLGDAHSELVFHLTDTDTARVSLSFDVVRD